jgi:hypothetical protein
VKRMMRMMRQTLQLVLAPLKDVYGQTTHRIFHNSMITLPSLLRFQQLRNENVRHSHNLVSHNNIQQQTQHDDRYVNFQYAPVNFDKSSVLVFPDIISEKESVALLKDIDVRVTSKRYQRGHWDAGMSVRTNVIR